LRFCGRTEQGGTARLTPEADYRVWAGRPKFETPIAEYERCMDSYVGSARAAQISVLCVPKRRPQYLQELANDTRLHASTDHYQELG
jgi:hypothetical protein